MLKPGALGQTLPLIRICTPQAKMNRKFPLFTVLLLGLSTASAQSNSVIFRETGFPATDSAPAPEPLLQHALPSAQFAPTPPVML